MMLDERPDTVRVPGSAAICNHSGDESTMKTHTKNHTTILRAPILLVAGCALAPLLIACDTDEDDAGQAGFEEVTEQAFRGCTFSCTFNTPSAGGLNISNGDAQLNDWFPLYGGSSSDEGRIVGVDMGYLNYEHGAQGQGYYWHSTDEVDAFRINYTTAAFEISRSKIWESPVDYNHYPTWVTRLTYELFPYGRNSNVERTCAEVFITGSQTTTANGHTVMTYGVSSRVAAWNNGCPVMTHQYNSVCSAGQWVTFFPRTWLSDEVALSQEADTRHFNAACQNSSFGKMRTVRGMLPQSGGSAHYGVPQFNAGAKAYMAWYDGQARTTDGTAIKMKDLYYNPPKFDDGADEIGTVVNTSYGPKWTGDVREAVYTEDGASEVWAGSNFPFSEGSMCNFSAGKHRNSSYDPPFTALSGWSKLDSWVPSEGAADSWVTSEGVAVWVPEVTVYRDCG